MSTRHGVGRAGRSAAALTLAITLGVAGSASCGSENAVVGGACADGYTECDLACVDLQTDHASCGACGHACGAGVACAGGVCGGTALDATASGDGSDGAARDGAPFDSAGLDGSRADGSSGDGASGDGSGDDGASTGDGGAGEAGPAPDACAPPYDTPASCGSCGHACTSPDGLCAPADGGFDCVPTCTSPLVECSGRCVDTTNDPDNCGTCGVTCPSQYCLNSVCEGTVAGGIVIIGHDFKGTKETDQQAKLLINSVFYNPATSVRVLSFEHYDDTAAVQNGTGILTSFAKGAFTLTVTPTSDDTLITKGGLTVATTDVLVVWDQPNAPAGALATLGAAWAPNLMKFVQAGGRVIVLDAALGTGEMPAFATAAGLLAMTGHSAVAAQTPADVPSAGLGIARGMTSVYLTTANSASFTTAEASGSSVLYIANVRGFPAQLLAVQKIIH